MDGNKVDKMNKTSILKSIYILTLKLAKDEQTFKLLRSSFYLDIDVGTSAIDFNVLCFKITMLTQALKHKFDVLNNTGLNQFLLGREAVAYRSYFLTSASELNQFNNYNIKSNLKITSKQLVPLKVLHKVLDIVTP